MNFTTEELAAEEWRTVPSAAGYEVSSLGRLRSTKRGVIRLMRPCLNNGYFRTTLSVNAVESLRYVHELVCEAFIGPRPPGLVVRHFPDRTRTNCRLSNLSYATESTNQLDRAVHGTDNAGERHPLARLSADAVRLMRWLSAGHGVSSGELSCWFGVSERHARKILSRGTWKVI